ncbi:MHS family MFS transporter [Janthinobacterium sp. 344]|uniref:MHS family MFS transporter n=1 Tax=Janthinobacterium sp. 344 TaxID=1566280 RepID=UPI001114564F|nr:MHS family MFS transporter [Janthinobacterium sp. 344]
MSGLLCPGVGFFGFSFCAGGCVLVFWSVFLPAGWPSWGVLRWLCRFGLGFFAWLLGCGVFCSFWGCLCCVFPLVAGLLAFGISGVILWLVGWYAALGGLAALLVAVWRFGPGLGLGGAWGGSVLVGWGHGGPGPVAWWGLFRSVGVAVGFFVSVVVFLLVCATVTVWLLFWSGCCLRFVGGGLLVVVGVLFGLRLGCRLAFPKVVGRWAVVALPLGRVLRPRGRLVLLGGVLALVSFFLFSVFTLFALRWWPRRLGFAGPVFLVVPVFGLLFFAVLLRFWCVLAGLGGRCGCLLWFFLAVALFVVVLGALLGSGVRWAVTVFVVVGLGVLGLCYCVLCRILSCLLRSGVGSTGASLWFILAGLLGASVGVSVARCLGGGSGLLCVGCCLWLGGFLRVGAFLFVCRSGTCPCACYCRSCVSV